MPRQSRTGNAHKRCGCARTQQASCRHPWFVSYKARKNHAIRSGQRYRRNLDVLIGFHPSNLSEAKGEARRAIEAWLHGSDASQLQPADQPTLAYVLDVYHRRQDAPPREAEQFGPITSAIVNGRQFGNLRIAEINREALEMFQQGRPRVAGNRNLALLRAMFRWAVVSGLVPSTPFQVGSVAVVKLRSETARSRRLQGGESERLLLAARGLAPLIMAALETGCRRDELLTLQWSQVRFSPRAEIFLPAHKTKAKKDRRVPISSVLRPILESRQHDPAGERLPADAFVFGDELGRRRRSIKTAWALTCRRAGIVDLHFHDLRREAGSQWMDAGVPLATIQRWLGHANISQTSTYLGASLGGDEHDMQRFEERVGRTVAYGGIFPDPNDPDPTRSDLDATEKRQKIAIVPDPTGTVH